MSAAKFNVRNPAVKRILQEIKELQSESCPDFIADALEEDIFEWHFVIRGPPDTEFEGGIYHGRILLPADYPFKPPAFMMLTPNGRFQTGVKICLSISSHHPEHWQPSWSVRTALTALIAFMPSPGQGALGSLDFTKDERKQLAAKSVADVPKFGSAGRQAVIDDMHTRFLARQAAATAAGGARSSSGSGDGSGKAAAVADGATTDAGKAAELVDAARPPGAAADQGTQQAAVLPGAAGGPQQQQLQQQPQQQQRDVFSLSSGSTHTHEQQQQQEREGTLQEQQQPPAMAPGAPVLTPVGGAPHRADAPDALLLQRRQQQQQLQLQQQQLAAAGMGTVPGELPGDRGLTFLAVVLTVAIVAMLLKKVVVAFGDVRPML